MKWYVYVIFGIIGCGAGIWAVLLIIRCLRKESASPNDIYLTELLNGKPAIFKQKQDIKSQAALITYDKRREIPRSFEVGDLIGSGNFGSVHKGFVKELYSTHFKPDVAIKSISGHVGQNEIENILYEIKIMIYVKELLIMMDLLTPLELELID